MSFFILIVLTSNHSFAMLDFLGDQAKKALEIAAYTDAVSELVTEVAPDENIKQGAADVNARAERLRSQASELKYLSRTTQNALEGPDWTSRRLETNIRNTTDYVRKIKRLVTRVAALGLDGTNALTNLETNVALNEVQKNQQALLIQNEDAKLTAIEKEQEQRKEWAEFSEKQRQQRKKSNYGKH